MRSSFHGRKVMDIVENVCECPITMSNAQNAHQITQNINIGKQQHEQADFH